MARPSTRSWQCPEFEHSDNRKLEWVKNAIDDGRRWVDDHCSASDIERGVKVLSGKQTDDPTFRWSPLNTGRLKRDLREIIETLSNIRPFWGYQTDNKTFNDQADMMNKVSRSIYLESFVDRSLRDALQFGALTGAGFLHPFYARDLHGRGRGKFVFEPLGQPDVMPVQLPTDRNYQEAYAVTIRRKMGIAKAHALFPAYQSKLSPFARSTYSSGDSYVADRWSRARATLDGASRMDVQYCDIYYTYILDVRVNDTQNTIPMGQPGTSWYYEVPALGADIHRYDPTQGKMVSRPAIDDDCRLYPYRRLMISCDAALMYDGPAFEWHGMVPLIPLYLDDWAWEPTGQSLMKTAFPLHQAIGDLERGVMRVARARVDPAKQYNSDVTHNEAKLNSRTAEALDIFSPGLALGVDGDDSTPAMRPLGDQWMYEVPEFVPAFIEHLGQTMDAQLGIKDIQSLAKMKIMSDSVDKIEEAEGAVVVGTSRGMERSFRDLGEMLKYNIIQYMDTPRVMQYVGPDGIAASVFDYDPSSLVPSHAPGEKTDATSLLSKSDRARIFCDNLRFQIAPHSLHEIAQNQEKLNLLALQAKGFPIDPQTMAEKFNVGNWGSLDGSTILERLRSWEQMKVENQAALAKLAAAIMPPPPAEPGSEGGGGNPPQAAANPAAHIASMAAAPPAAPVGRPTTAAVLPHIEQKGPEGGGRVVLAESK